MANKFETIDDLSSVERIRLQNIVAKNSTERNAEETSFLNARLSYTTNVIHEKDSDGYILEASGDIVPEDGTIGFRKGATFIDSDKSIGGIVYVNIGDENDCSFVLLGKSGDSTVTVGTENADYICDGVADDVQINAAIQSLGASGGTIQLSEGTFVIAAPIILNKNNCVIRGSGLDATKLILATGANCNIFQNVTSEVIIFNSIQALTADGNKENNTSGYGCYIDQSASGHFWDFYLRDVWFKSCFQDGFYAYDGHGYVLDHVLSEYNTGNGITFKTGGIDQPEIRNGTIKLNGGDGIHLGANGGTIMDNEITDNDGYGIRVTSIGAAIVGNNVNANKLSGIYVTTQYGVSIINNVIKANYQHGISVATSDVIIVGNFLRGNSIQTANTYDEIRVAHHRALVSQNIIVGNSQSKYGVNFSASWASGSTCIGNNISGLATASVNDLAVLTLQIDQTISKNIGVVFPIKATTAAAPAYVIGGMYFDTTLNKMRIGGASGWETVTSA